jgi:hypothetical protein
MVETAGLSDGFGEPGASCSERIPGHRESDLKGQASLATAAIQLRTHYPGRDRKTTGTQSAPRSGLYGQTGYDPGVVSETGRPEFDGSKHRQYPGRPPVSAEVEALVVRMARENSGWGYDRLVGALANLGHHVPDQTVGNILRRHGIALLVHSPPTHSYERQESPRVIVGFKAIDRRRGGFDLLRRRPLAQTGSGPHVMNQLSDFDIDEFLLELVPSGWIAPNHFVIQFFNRGGAEFLFS